VHPFTVMLALPLAMLGAFGLLYVLSWVNHFGTGFYAWANYAPNPPEIAKTLSKLVPRDFSDEHEHLQPGRLGLLIGLVTKNSILLVEFANRGNGQGGGCEIGHEDCGVDPAASDLDDQLGHDCRNSANCRIR